MLTICWAAKGGSGTTVYAAARALASSAPMVLIDLDGDVMPALGLPRPDAPGVHDWLRSDAATDRLKVLEHEVTGRLSTIPAGRVGGPGELRWVELADHLAAERRDVIVDVGSRRPPPALLTAADEALLVTRACYLSLQHAVADAIVPTGIVLIEEPGRSLRRDDIEAALGAPVVSTALLDPAIARAVDAGLLLSRLPGAWRRQLRQPTGRAA